MSDGLWGSKYHAPALGVVIAALCAFAIARLFSEELPGDLSAYVFAMRAFADGQSPYIGHSTSPHYMGYPYVYFPGTLYLVMAISWIPAHALAALDALAKLGCLLYSGRWIQRRYALPIAWPVLSLCALTLDPIYTDIRAGNLVLYMFVILLAIVDLSEREDVSWRRRLLTGVAFGLLLMFKPMWGIIAAWVAALNRRWGLVVGLALGAGAVFALAGLQPEMIPQWLEVLRRIREFWPGFDLGSVVPWLSPVAAITWGVMAVKVWRERPTEAWLWGCSFALAWPRLGNYSYIIALPLLAYISTRLEKSHVILACVPATILVAMIADMIDPTLVASLVVHYLWLLGLTGYWLLDKKPARPRA